MNRAIGHFDRHSWIGGATLLALVAIAFYPVLNAGFINFDDDGYIYANHRVMAGLTSDNIRWALTATDFFNWHPLTWLSLMLDASIWGENPLGYHLSNLLLHAANALLAWWILGKIVDRRIAWYAAAIWAIHPLRVESVAWASERKDVLCSFFGFAALGCYLRYAVAPSIGRYLSVVAFLILSLASKAMFVTLPMVLMLLDYWPLGRWDSRRWRTTLAEKLPLLAIIGAATVVAYLTQKNSGSVATWGEHGLNLRISNTLIAYVRYLMRLVRVHDLTAIYPMPRWEIRQIIGAAGVLVSLSVIAAWQCRRRPGLLVGWCWFLGAMVPVIGLVQLGSQSMADRYTYFPMIGLIVAGAASIPVSWLHHPASRRLLVIAIAVAVSCFSIFTNIQSRYWRNTITLFSRTVALTQHNYIALNNLGNAYLAGGDILNARDCYLKVLAIRPYVGETLSNLAYALYLSGDLQAAAQRCDQALRENTTHRMVINNAGMIYFRVGRIDESVSLFQRALQLFPENPESHSNLGHVMFELQQWEAAAKYYRQALALRPGDAKIQSMLNDTLQRQRQVGSAPKP